MKKFPDFVMSAANRVAAGPNPDMAGSLFQGADGVQVVFWQSEAGGEQPEHVHDFWEYALVIEGTFEGTVDGRVVHLGPGDECVIPPGAVHRGTYSPGYRAIDAFGARRVVRS
jgi:quercetin dioxygenase-like cupin family protein